METELKKVLIVGSAPDALRTASWDTSFFSHIIAINNAWMACPSWNCLIFPDDFPKERHPCADALKGKQVVTSQEFVPIQNEFGGFVYADGTMAFTAGYWALGALKPDVIAYIGCDMIYDAKPGQTTHFYGCGAADPLREDVTLQCLEAKSLRLQALAGQNGCAVVNLSNQQNSRLLFPRIELQALEEMTQNPPTIIFNKLAIQNTLRAESELGYMVESGRYWEKYEQFDSDKLHAIDALWLRIASQAVLTSDQMHCR
jgi:hypothetical protein